VQFEAENAGRPMEGHTTRMWERITNAADRQVGGKAIVDFGCGPGRFLDVVRRKGGLAIGIDLSMAVDAARKNFANDRDVLIVQGDLLKPPFRDGAFDGGFSIGVLHHTPGPKAGFAALARSVRPGGWVSCCVYPKDDFYDFASVRRFRALHSRLSRHFGYAPALAYSQFAARVLAPLFRRLKKTSLRRAVNYIERNWLVSLWLKDVRWRVLDTFDAITPKIASTHTEAEMAEWFEAAGCGGVHRTDWCPTAAAGVRVAIPERVTRAA
jgi:SAM-dependent methyltransferase